MYLTAQHVRSPHGDEALHSFLHLHEGAGTAPFPSDPLSVPQHHPGNLVAHATTLPQGGNDVLAYLDIVAPDVVWSQRIPPWATTSTEWWTHSLAPLGEMMVGSPLPWVLEAGGVHVIFSATPTQAPSAEYDQLLEAALGLWERWRLCGGA